MAGGLGDFVAGLDALLVPGVLRSEDGRGAGLPLQVAARVLGGLAGQALVDVVADALLDEGAVGRGAPGIGTSGLQPLLRHERGSEAQYAPPGQCVGVRRADGEDVRERLDLL